MNPVSRVIQPWQLLLGAAAVLSLPIIEFMAFYWVAGRIGLLPALLLLVGTSIVGVALLRRQGASAVSRLLDAMRSGRSPAGAARESLMVAAGGILMILPGFVTDVIGLAMMFPSLLRTLGSGSSVTISRGPRRPPADPNGRIVELSEAEWRNLDDRSRSS